MPDGALDNPLYFAKESPHLFILVPGITFDLHTFPGRSINFTTLPSTSSFIVWPTHPVLGNWSNLPDKPLHNWMNAFHCWNSSRTFIMIPAPALSSRLPRLVGFYRATQQRMNLLQFAPYNLPCHWRSFVATIATYEYSNFPRLPVVCSPPNNNSNKIWYRHWIIWWIK